MYCKDGHSNLLCLVECNAISEMTWHKDGIYIYVTRRYRMYDEVKAARVYHIKCDWTSVKDTENNVIVSLQKKGIKTIFRNDTIYDECPKTIFIGF